MMYHKNAFRRLWILMVLAMASILGQAVPAGAVVSKEAQALLKSNRNSLDNLIAAFLEEGLHSGIAGQLNRSDDEWKNKGNGIITVLDAVGSTYTLYTPRGARPPKGAFRDPKAEAQRTALAEGIADLCDSIADSFLDTGISGPAFDLRELFCKSSILYGPEESFLVALRETWQRFNEEYRLLTGDASAPQAATIPAGTTHTEPLPLNAWTQTPARDVFAGLDDRQKAETAKWCADFLGLYTQERLEGGQ